MLIMKSIRIFFVLLFSLIATNGFAQLAKWSLDSCMIYAIDNGYAVERAKRDLKIARNAYTASIGSHLPSLSASVGAGSGFGRGIDPETNTYQNRTSFNNNYGIGLGLPIFNAFSLINSTLQSKVAVARAKSEIENTIDQLAIDVMAAWADAVFRAETAELTRKRVEAYRTDLRLATRRGELGAISEADVAQIAAALATEESLLVERDNNYELSMLELKHRMNFPIEDTLSLQLEVYNNNIAPRRELPQWLIPDDLSYLPRVEILNATLKIQHYSLRIARSGYYPSISASAGVSTNYYTMLAGANNEKRNFLEQLSTNIGQSISVGMSIPIFSGLAVRSSVRSAKIRYEQAESDYNESMRLLRTEITAVKMDVAAAQKKVEQARKARYASDLAYRAVQGKYRNGTASVIELQTVYNQLFAAQADLLAASLTLEIKSRESAYFHGEPLIK